MYRYRVRSQYSKRFFLTGCVICAVAFLNGCAQTTSSIPGQDSAPKQIPGHLDRVPNATPKVEPLSRYGNRFKKNSTNTYVALKKRYNVMPTSRGYAANGQASWYGTKFQGRKTSSGEPYDMFAMTAAHKTLPLPTYARVTNLDNGRCVIVKVNDRGPFHNDRLIDLSYVAAHKLGILGKGTGRVRVESVDPRDHHGQIPGEKRNFFGRPSRTPAPHSGGVIAANTAQSQKATSHSAHSQKNTRNTTGTLAATSAVVATTTTSAVTKATHNTVANANSPHTSPSGWQDSNETHQSVPVAKTNPALQSKHESSAATATSPIAKPQLYLQLGAFNQKERAESFIKEVSKLSKYQASIITQQKNNQALFKVRLGPFSNQQQVTEAKKALTHANLPTPILFRNDF